MIRKRKAALLVAALALMMILLASCGSSSTPGDGTKPDNDQEERELIVYELNEDKSGYTVVGVTRDVTEITVPATHNGLPVAAVADRAFRGKSTIVKITLPESVVRIGDDAFSGCSALKSVNLPSGITEISFGTFSGCTSLESIELPSGLRTIGNMAFAGCVKIIVIVIPDGVTEIGSGAFRDCAGLKEIEIPDGVKSIEKSAFHGCRSLESVKIPESVEKIEDDAFKDCITIIVIILPKNLADIASGAFEGCISLREVVGENFNSVAPDAFSGCPLLENPPHVHQYGEWIAEIGAECEKDGVLGHYTCSECKVNFDAEHKVLASLVIPAKWHAYGEWVNEIPAECEKDGVLGHYTCSECKVNFDEEHKVLASLVIPAKGHTYGEWVSEISAECEKDGVLGHYTCSECKVDFDAEHKVLASLVIPAKGHTYGEWVAEIPAECEKDGVLGHYTCSECKVDFDAEHKVLASLVIPAKGHTYGEWVAEIPAECEKDGVRGHYECLNCDADFDWQYLKIDDLTLPAIGHYYGKWFDEVKPSCEGDGVCGHYTCANCGTYFDAEHNKLEEIRLAPAGHSLGAWVEEIPAGCTENGVRGYFFCSACYKYFDADGNKIASLAIPSLGHNEVTVPGKEPTYEESGLTDGSVCSRCDKVFIEQKVIGRYVRITFACDENAVTVTLPEKVSVGDTLRIQITANAGYIYDGLYLDGVRCTTAVSYSVKASDRDYAFEVRTMVGDRWDGTIASSFAGGSGTSSSPYLISTAEQLARLASLINNTAGNSYYNKYYKLTTNIDLAGINWTPIGTMYGPSNGSADTTRAFQGNFDGCGYTIYNMNISKVLYSSYGYVGLFGCAINASISDINMYNVTITASNCTGTLNLGSIVGRADSTTVTRCFVSCSIGYSTKNSNDIFLGAVVGRAYSAKITNCHAVGSVSAYNESASRPGYVGGILGYASGATVTAVISEITTSCRVGKSAIAGGIVGYAGESAKIAACISLGSGFTESFGYYYTYADRFVAYNGGATTSNFQSTVTYTPEFFLNTLGWSSANWDVSGVADGKLPILIQT